MAPESKWANMQVHWDRNCSSTILSASTVKNRLRSLSILSWRLHLGVYFNNPSCIDVRDCSCDSFYHLFRDTSRKNTYAYEKVFNTIPTDKVKNFDELKSFTSQRVSSLHATDPYEVRTRLLLIFLLLFEINSKFWNSTRPSIYSKVTSRDSLSIFRSSSCRKSRIFFPELTRPRV